MPRSISGLVMQLMRVANVGGGDFRAEVTSEIVHYYAVSFQG